MAEKSINSRIVHKHDSEANWTLATNFTPKQGEIIIYDIDDTYSYERIKVGDGIHNVNNLPFYLGDLVGDVPVSEQISSAINSVTADDFGVYVQASEPTEAVVGDIWIDTINDPSYIIPTLPQVTEADNGKVLMVVNGQLQLVNLNLTVDANGVVAI